MVLVPTLVQAIKDGASPVSPDRANSAAVMQFVKTTLVGMSPSSLRKTYSKRTAEFLEWEIGTEDGLEGRKDSEMRPIEEHIKWLFNHLSSQANVSEGPKAKLCVLES